MKNFHFQITDESSGLFITTVYHSLVTELSPVRQHNKLLLFSVVSPKTHFIDISSSKIIMSCSIMFLYGHIVVSPLLAGMINDSHAFIKNGKVS